MGENNLIPISDEQAKLVRAASEYLADILGDLPKDLLGLLVGDRVKAKRLERATGSELPIRIGGHRSSATGGSCGFG